MNSKSLRGPFASARAWSQVLAPVDMHLARTLGRLGQEETPEVLWAAALASVALRQGHGCIDLRRIAAFVRTEGDAALPPLPAPEVWLDQLRRSPLVQEEPEEVHQASDPSEPSGPSMAMERPMERPLVLQGSRLYLHRYHHHEVTVAKAVLRRLSERPPVDETKLREGLHRLFPAQGQEGGSAEPFDGQKLAGAVAVLQRFCIISGGPGTGKTTTVVKILALLVEQAQHRNASLQFAIMAPTGKAAARLREAIDGAKQTLVQRGALNAAVAAAIPHEASTVHRALGALGHGTGRFLHDEDNPLAADVILVDEASMVDLPLMARLLSAARPEARILLLGDRHQLASVDVGAVLGDFCGPAGPPAFSDAFAQRLEAITGMAVPRANGTRSVPAVADCMVQLRKNYRYGDGSPIAALAQAVNDGDDERAAALLRDGQDAVQLHEGASERGLGSALTEACLRGYGPYLKAATAREAFEAFGRYRILSAHRQGPWGVVTLGQQVEQTLRKAGLLQGEETFYPRRPLLVTENDASVRLFNGDIGFVESTADGARVLFFPADGPPRELGPSRLPPHETVFAMTVHKCQGSEFDEVAFVLPEEDSPLLTRELIYTAITRPKARLRIYGNLDVFRKGVARPIERGSGLQARLWG